MKKMLILSVVLCSLLGLSFTSIDDGLVKIELNIKKLKNDEGGVGVQLLNKENRVVAMAYLNIRYKKCRVTFENLQAGTYGVRFYHDANGNGKMDKNMVNIPSEGYGFSNNAIGYFGLPPDFKEILFDAKRDTKITLKAVY